MQKNIFIIVLFLSAMICACSSGSEKMNAQPTATSTDLNAFQTTLPHAKGYEAFQANCVSCHSARYVQMQPDLPEKTWTTLVTKMQKTFGAPISDSSAKEIVQYLVAIKGK